MIPLSLHFLGLAEDPGLVQYGDGHSQFLPKTHIITVNKDETVRRQEE